MADDIDRPEQLDFEVLKSDGSEEAASLHINDWFLQELIELAEVGVELPVTLTVGGSHINGRLVSGVRFFEEISANMSDSTAVAGLESLPDTLSKRFKSHTERYLRPGEDRPPLGALKPNFVHLRDARWQSPDGKTFPSNGSYWRGKISAVDGFMIGEIRVELA